MFCIETWQKWWKIQDKHYVCVAHMHSYTARTAKGGYTEFFDKLANAICTYNPTVVCGDFNMALCDVATQLADRRGPDVLSVQLAAAYFWKDAKTGEPCLDSTAMFVAGRPGTYNAMGVFTDDIILQNEVLERNADFLAGQGEALPRQNKPERHCLWWHTQPGPGQPLRCYRVKEETAAEKLERLFKPHPQSPEAKEQYVAALDACGPEVKHGLQPCRLERPWRCRARRLNISRPDGGWVLGAGAKNNVSPVDWPGGFHQPLLLVMRHPNGSRSEEADERRKAKKGGRRPAATRPVPALELTRLEASQAPAGDDAGAQSGGAASDAGAAGLPCSARTNSSIGAPQPGATGAPQPAVLPGYVPGAPNLPSEGAAPFGTMVWPTPGGMPLLQGWNELQRARLRSGELTLTPTERMYLAQNVQSMMLEHTKWVEYWTEVSWDLFQG